MKHYRHNLGPAEVGLSLIELMISITLGLLIVMAATALLVSTKSGYVTQDEDAHLQDTGRYALDTISRAVRQTAYVNWDRNEAPITVAAEQSANITGFDAMSLKSKSPGIDSPVSKSVNGSDVLALRFFGVGSSPNGDGSMLNCAGFGVGAPNIAAEAEERRGWSIFYVSEDASGEPELYCKYLGNDSWASQSIARGVESFQVLYGLDLNADGMPDRFLNATGISGLDDTLKLEGATAEEKARDKNRKTNWKKIVSVKLALLLRGTQNARVDSPSLNYDLFGKEYADAHSAADVGVRVTEQMLPAKVRNRMRRPFVSTVLMRNGGGAQ
jgi:type IV pilus assembly protein PilW